MSGAIVVGVDGSDASREALRWGAEEARLRFAQLVAVHAWSFVPPQPIGDPGMLAMPAGDLPGQLSAESDAARLALDEVVSDALGAEPGIEVERKLWRAMPETRSLRKVRARSSSWSARTAGRA